MGVPTALKIMSPVTSLFGLGGDKSDPTSFTSGGGTVTPGSLAPEGIDKSQDSLTQYTRSLSNYAGEKGKSAYESGMDTEAKGEGDLDPVKEYFHRLLYGDSGEVASAMQPEADQISQQFGQIRQMFAQSGARGGGTASTVTQAPYEQARQLAELTSKARRGAADSSGNLALAEANLGLNKAGLGKGMLDAAQQALMARRGQNFQVDTANRQMATSGMSNLLSTLI